MANGAKPTILVHTNWHLPIALIGFAIRQPEKPFDSRRQETIMGTNGFFENKEMYIGP
jgi:hypothetical protein